MFIARACHADRYTCARPAVDLAHVASSHGTVESRHQVQVEDPPRISSIVTMVSRLALGRDLGAYTQ